MRGGGVLVALLALGLALVAESVAKRPPAPTPLPLPSTAPWPSAAVPLPGSFGHGVVSGRVAISALTLDLQLSQRAARAGQPVRAEARLENQTDALVETVTVSLHGPLASFVVSPGGDRVIRQLAAGALETVSWIVCAPTAGIYTLVARATVHGARITSAPRLLSVTRTGTCSAAPTLPAR
jgi:hypothetical protein